MSEDIHMLDLDTALLIATTWTVTEIALYFAFYSFALGRRNRVTEDLVAALRDNEGAKNYAERTGHTVGSLLLMGTIVLPTSFALLVVLSSPILSGPNSWFKIALALGSPLLYSW